jgi:hypothetical protein
LSLRYPKGIGNDALGRMPQAAVGQKQTCDALRPQGHQAVNGLLEGWNGLQACRFNVVARV